MHFRMQIISRLELCKFEYYIVLKHVSSLRSIQAGLDIGCSRCNFSVLDWNTPSIEFYKKHGAVDLSEAEGWLAFRMNQHEMKLFCST